MKKIFSLALVFFTMLFAANAQYLLNEGFEDPNSNLPTGWTVIDNDGDGNNWYVLNNSQSSSGSFNVHSGEGHITSASYASGALTPDNWLITPQINLTTDATLTFWVAGQDPNWASEYFSVYVATSPTVDAFTATTAVVSGTATATMTQYTVNLSSYTGQQVYIAFRHHNVTDMFRLNLDDVQITFVPTAPTIVANNQNFDFGTIIIGDTLENQTTVTGFSLTTGITATTTAPFAVSADGITFGTTATLGQTGGTLYIQYAPATAGYDSSSVVLSSTGATDVTINVIGNGLDCSGITIPYTPDFSSTLGCWTNRSDSLESGWFLSSEEDIEGQVYSLSATGSYFLYDVAHDNWLTSPNITMPTTGTYEIAWKVKPYLTSYAGDHYGVYVISGNVTTLLFEETLNDGMVDFVQRAVAIPSTITGDFQVAFRHFNSEGGYVIILDEISLRATSAPSFVLHGPAAVENGVAATYTAECFNADSFSWTVDGTAVTETTNTLTHTFTTDGNHTVAVTATNTAGSASDSMVTEVYTCNAITTVPYTLDFETGMRCWSMVSIDDANDDKFGLYEDDDAFDGNYDFRFSSYSSAADYNQYLISPELSLGQTNHTIKFQYRGETSDDSFRVLASTTTNEVSAFTNVLGEVLTTETSWTEVVYNIPAGTKYVAINYFGDYEWYLYIDNIMFNEIEAPTVTLNGPTSVSLGTPATFTANSPLANTYAWTVDGAAVTGTTNTLTYTFQTAGSHTVAVTASNNAGSGNASLTVNVVSCDVASLPYNEDFESGVFPPTCWDLISYNNVTWTGNVDDDGNNWAYVTYAQTLQNEKLITNPINFSNHTNITLTFDFLASYTYIMSDDEEEQYNLLIYTSTDNGNTFSSTPVYDMRNDQGEFTSWEQTTATVDLSALAGQSNVRLMFNMYGTYGAELWLDNIHIEGVVGVNEYDNNVSVYPNPANNVINVNASSNINTIEVFNMMGQKVAAFDANDTNIQINTTALSNGMYMMRISTENGVYNQKFTVAR